MNNKRNMLVKQLVASEKVYVDKLTTVMEASIVTPTIL